MMNFDNFKKTGWRVSLSNFEFDNYKDRLIVNVATGRKYWPLFSEIIDIDKGLDDMAIKKIESSLYFYTHPMIDRFIEELETVMTKIYGIKIKLEKPKNHLK